MFFNDKCVEVLSFFISLTLELYLEAVKQKWKSIRIVVHFAVWILYSSRIYSQPN